jgi:hypothetical protein
MALSIEDTITAYESVGKKVFILPTTAAFTDSGAKHFLKKLATAPRHSKGQSTDGIHVVVLADQAPMGGGGIAARLCVEDKIEGEKYDDDRS